MAASPSNDTENRMKRRAVLNIAAVGVLGLVMGLDLPAQTPAPARSLDQLSVNDGRVHLVIFNPEVFNIRALATLRKSGTFNIPNLTVIGVYHVKQTGNFEESRKYVAGNGLDWFKFHEVSVDISEVDLFRKNACTPEFAEIVKKADAVIFFGGPDIPASVYKKKTNLLTSIEDPYRHYLEVSAIFHLLGGFQDEKSVPLLDARPRFPVLGICLGFQSLNVGTGGTLTQDIWAEVYGKTTVEDAIALGPEQWHNNPYRLLFPLGKLMSYNFHSLELGEKSFFTTAMGFKTTDHPRILSSHHQAAEKLGKDLVPIATSRDGKIIEAVAHKKYPCVLGVQFHPEHPLLFDAEPRHRQKPGDPLTSYRAILEGTPPSLEFNQAIWKWFVARLVESHGK
jgi:putative glutamine amidotransferase